MIEIIECFELKKATGNTETNPDQFDHVVINSHGANQFQLGWEELLVGQV